MTKPRPYQAFRLIINFRHSADPAAILDAADYATQDIGLDREGDHWAVFPPGRNPGDILPRPGGLIVLWDDQESCSSVKFGTRAEAERRLREICENCELEEL